MKNELTFQKIIYLKNIDTKQAIELCKQLLNENIDNEFKSDVYHTLGNIVSSDSELAIKCLLKSIQKVNIYIF